MQVTPRTPAPLRRRRGLPGLSNSGYSVNPPPGPFAAFRSAGSMVVCEVIAVLSSGALHDGVRRRWRPNVRVALPDRPCPFGRGRGPTCIPGSGIASATVPAGTGLSAEAEPCCLLFVVQLPPGAFGARGGGAACSPPRNAAQRRRRAPRTRNPRRAGVAGAVTRAAPCLPGAAPAAYAASAASGQRKGSPLASMRCRMTASRRAKATHAFLKPLRLRNRRAQSLSG